MVKFNSLAHFDNITNL